MSVAKSIGSSAFLVVAGFMALMPVYLVETSDRLPLGPGLLICASAVSFTGGALYLRHALCQPAHPYVSHGPWVVTFASATTFFLGDLRSRYAAAYGTELPWSSLAGTALIVGVIIYFGYAASGRVMSVLGRPKLSRTGASIGAIGATWTILTLDAPHAISGLLLALVVPPLMFALIAHVENRAARRVFPNGLGR